MSPRTVTCMRKNSPRSSPCSRQSCPSPSRMPASTCGCAPPSPTPPPRNSSTATIMSPCCPAASLPAKRTGSTPARTSSAWRWSPTWTRPWKPHDASPNSPKNSKTKLGKTMPQLQAIIEEAFERRAEITPRNVDAQLKETISTVIEYLDQGKLRVAEKINGVWVTHQWIKKAVLLSFRIEDNTFIKGGFTNYFDKVPSKFADYNSKEFREGGFRVVPPAAARRGAYIAKNVVLMPSYVNIGGYVDEGTMVDTWATVGSCAQIGKNVHLSGGVGIGGVLEPVQANPTIIEDNCFIGARSEVVEGVIVEEGSVISMGVYIGQSTKIYDRETGEIHYGRVPAGSVVVSGNLPSKDGSYSLYCAVIVKKVDEKTLGKVGINELLRGI